MTDSALQAPEFPSLDAIEAALWPALMLLVFVITAVLVDLMVILAARFRLVDLPNRRSAHSLPTARGGGVAIVLLSFIASLVVIVRWPSLGSRVLLGLVLPSVVIAGVGLIDDIRPLRPLLRLVFQLVVAAGMTLVLGPLTEVSLPGREAMSFDVLGWPLTILWIVGMINAFNFMDGSDGMAALAAVVVGVSTAVLGFETRSLAVMLLAAFAAAAAGGFLVFNWPPARVFMGDVGSGYLGTMVAGLPLLFAPAERVTLFVPAILCLWPYVFDPFLSVLRRVWNRQNPLKPHREFLFHRLIRSGVSHGKTAVLYAGLSAAGGAIGLAMLDQQIPAGMRAQLPWGIVVMAALLTLGVERRCSRVGLGLPAHSPSSASH